MDRSKMIRLAATLKQGNPERIALLSKLAEGKASALDYQTKMTKGPVTEQDIAGHYHILEHGETLLENLHRFYETLPMQLKRDFQEWSEPMRYFLNTIMVPASSLPEPTKKGPRPPKRPSST